MAASTCTIMQPYLYPYIGYFHLLKAADVFVIFDDVHFIKRGWINRNAILLGNKPHRFTLPLVHTSQNRCINEHHIVPEKQVRLNLLALIKKAYVKAPCFKTVFPLIEDILLFPENQLARFLAHSLRQLAAFLELDTRFVLSSDIDKPSSLKGQEKILAIARHLGSKTYINAIGGKALYERSAFEQQGIELKFVQTLPIAYPQFQEPFVPDLSIIDILMFNEPEGVTRILNYYILTD